MKQSLAGRLIYTALVPLIIIGLAFVTYRLVFSPAPKETRRSLIGNVASKKPDKNAEAEPVLPNVEVEKPEISHLVNGKVSWKIKAESIKSDADSGIARLYDSQGLFLRGKDSGLEFSGPLAIYNSKEKSVRIEGGVRGKLLPEEHALNADQINWNEKNGKIVAEKVSIKVGDARLTGGRMEMKPGVKKAAFSGGLRIEIPVARRDMRGRK
jgi:hypothetical protein